MSDLPIVAWLFEYGAVDLPAGHPSRITDYVASSTKLEADADAAACDFAGRVFPVTDHAAATASLASAQQRIEELERALGEMVASHDDPGPPDDMPGRGWMAAHDAHMARRSAAWAAARALVARAIGTREGGDAQAAPGRSPESAVATATRPSKGFLKGESPQATWPFAQDDKGTGG